MDLLSTSCKYIPFKVLVSDVNLHPYFEDGCFLPFDFYYSSAPQVLMIDPQRSPRFGSTMLTVYADNLQFLKVGMRNRLL